MGANHLFENGCTKPHPDGDREEINDLLSTRSQQVGAGSNDNQVKTLCHLRCLCFLTTRVALDTEGRPRVPRSRQLAGWYCGVYG